MILDQILEGVVLVFLVWQVVIPLLLGLPLLPLLRRSKQDKLLNRISEVKQDIVEAGLESDLHDLEKARETARKTETKEEKENSIVE